METMEKYPMSARARQLASIHKDIDRMVDLEFEMAIDEMESEADE